MVRARKEHDDAVALVRDVQLGSSDRIAEVLAHRGRLLTDALDVRLERVADQIGHPGHVEWHRRADPVPPAPALEDLEAIGAEPLAGDHAAELVERHERAPRHLLGLPRDLAVPHDVVRGSPDVTLGALVSMEEPKRRLHVDAELFEQLPPGAVVVGLARGVHPPGGHVEQARVHVLGLGAAMHVDLARAVPHDHVRAPMTEAPRPHLATRNGLDHPVVRVDDVDELVPRIHDRTVAGVVSCGTRARPR